MLYTVRTMYYSQFIILNRTIMDEKTRIIAIHYGTGATSDFQPLPLWTSYSLADGSFYVCEYYVTIFLAEQLPTRKNKNIKRYIAHTIVIRPKPREWQMGHTSDSIMLITWSTRILTITIRKMGQLNTHSPIYCIKNNWENWLHLRHTLGTGVPGKHFRTSAPSGMSP